MVAGSQIQRVPGGHFGRDNRFKKPATLETPGPAYSLPSTFNSPIPGGSLYKPNSPGGRKISPCPGLPHPTNDRTAWMIGSVRDGACAYNDIAQHNGPAQYSPDVRVVKPFSPSNAFSRSKRFEGLTKQYISKEHNNANMCTASQGPKYLPKTSQMDLNERGIAPKYSFGSKGATSDRSAFLRQNVQGGYLYQASPATSNKQSNISPANYDPNEAVIQKKSPSGKMGRADRFKPSDKLFLSNKHSKHAKIGLNSPGPVYSPTNHCIGYKSRGFASAGRAWK